MGLISENQRIKNKKVKRENAMLSIQGSPIFSRSLDFFTRLAGVYAALRDSSTLLATRIKRYYAKISKKISSELVVIIVAW